MDTIDSKWGISAIDDVAIIVRKIRASGIKVLGCTQATRHTTKP